MKILLGVLLATGMSLAEVRAQNTAVTWSAFNMGFAATASATTNAQSAAGQLVVGSAQSTNTGTVTGFIPGASGTLTAVQNSVVELPTTYALEQNYPNPFNPTTTITYALPLDAHVGLKVYDVLGRELLTLVDEHEKAGYHSTTFNASSFSSGIYFYRIQAGEFSQTKKLILLR